MASITIRNLDERIKRKLRLRAAQRNRSMEDGARDILRMALAREPAQAGNLADAIRIKTRALGGRRAGATAAPTDARAARFHMIILDTNVLSETLRPRPSAILPAVGWNWSIPGFEPAAPSSTITALSTAVSVR